MYALDKFHCIYNYINRIFVFIFVLLMEGFAEYPSKKCVCVCVRESGGGARKLHSCTSSNFLTTLHAPGESYVTDGREVVGRQLRSRSTSFLLAHSEEYPRLLPCVSVKSLNVKGRARFLLGFSLI